MVDNKKNTSSCKSIERGNRRSKLVAIVKSVICPSVGVSVGRARSGCGARGRRQEAGGALQQHPRAITLSGDGVKYR